MVAVEQAMQWFLVLILCLCWEIQYYESFNIELEGGTFFNRSQDSHFGQRVAQLQSNKRNWIIVSAPLEKNQTGTRTGVVYRCQYATESCQPLSVVAPEECGAISLGLSLSTQTHSQPSVLACGPTFSHQCGQNTYQNGICFLFNGSFQNVARFPPKTQDCFTAKVDLAFLIDGSGSILPDDFTRMKDFIMTMLRRFKLRDVQFAVMQFSHIIMKEFNFEEYERSKRNEMLVSHIQQLSGDTYTPSAIKKLVNEIFIPDSGLRADSKRVMVVITDGKSNDDRTSFNEAIALAEDKDILRFAVGVGPDFQTEDGQQELRIIASNSTNDTVFSIENFKALTTIQEKLQAKIFAIEGAQGMLNMTSFQHEMSQEGFSSILTSDAVVLGTVGAYGWSGGLLLYQGAQETFINISRTDKEIWNSYLGYSVQEASGADVVYYLVGAPRYRHRGEVIIFQKGSNGSWEDVQRIPGEQIGSYFGSEICTLDVTGDGQTDLVLIGAPLYRGQDFGGKVIICTMTPRGNFSCRDSLRGEKGYELGRFGSAIAGLRDLNGDGLSDVAVGAPLEDDHHGSVYIYHGRRTGIHLTYSQRIEGANYSPALRYFGHSISGVMDVSGDSLTDLVVGALGTVTVLRSRPVLNVSVTVLFNPWQIPFEAYQCQPAKWSNQPFGNATTCFQMRRLVSDNWGVLKANITYNLLLDAGRQKGRAVFKTLSRSLTISQLLLTGKKICQQFPIILPSCVKDYLEPIDLSLNFTLAGEVITGSKGLSPILNKYKETSEKYKLPFQKDCGMDECVDYLRVVFNFSGGDLAVIGRDTVLILTVVLENAHEDSSHTQLNFLHPSQLSFRKISNVQPSSDQIVCSDLLTDQLMERGNLSCAVNHPVFRKASRVTFNAEFDISSSEREEEIMNFTITASSGNSLRITNESSLTRNLSLRYAVNIVTSGIEYTRHVNFTAGSKDLRLVKHSYQVENLGPRSLPIHVKVMVPTRIGTHSLWNVTVSERHPGNHSVCQPSVHRLAAVQSESPKLPQDYVRLDCGIALCMEMLCEVAALEKHSSVIFDIQGELMSAALTELNENKLLLVSNVSLSYDEDKYVDISEDAAHYREAMIITQVDIFKAVNRLGVILGGTFGGLILLVIIIIVFYKLGFFKRNGKAGEGDRIEMTSSNGGEGSSTE